MVEIGIVDPVNVSSAWPHVTGYIDSALKREAPQLTTNSYFKAIIGDGEAQLFVAQNGEKTEGMAIIQRQVWPLASVCKVLIIAGISRAGWRNKMLDAIREIARLNGCEYVISEGRKGWERAIPSCHFGSANFYEKVT